MAVYRISEKGLEELVSRAGWQALPLTVGVLLVAIVVGGFNKGWDTTAEIWYVYLIIGLVAFFMWRYREQSAMRKAGKSISVKLDDDTISVDSGPVHASIKRQEVTSIRDTKAGMYVRGQGFKTTILLLKELENYEELREKVNIWAPADAARELGRPIFVAVRWLTILVALVLFGAAFTVTDSVVGPVLCIAAAVTSVGCMVLVTRSKYVDLRTKREMIVGLLPVLAFLYRAHYLWTGSNLER